METPYLADSHTHLDQYQPEEAPDILQRAGDAGVGLVVTAGVTEESSLKCIDLANRYDSVYAGIGIHPMDVTEPMSEAAYQRFRSMALANPKVVCISEVGLDFSEGMPDFEMQTQVLRQHVRLARELDLPVIFHSREYPGRMDDHYRTLQVLQEENVQEVGGAMHYFQWDADIARVCLEMDLAVSIGKPLLRLPQLQETVKDIPLDSIVLETDAYPQYFKRNRMRWTEPKDIKDVAEKLAELKGLPADEVAKATTNNLLRVLKGRASASPVQPV